VDNYEYYNELFENFINDYKYILTNLLKDNLIKGGAVTLLQPPLETELDKKAAEKAAKIKAGKIARDKLAATALRAKQQKEALNKIAMDKATAEKAALDKYKQDVETEQPVFLEELFDIKKICYIYIYIIKIKTMYLHINL